MSELIIRPAVNDHKVLADLLAPTAIPGGRPISRLVMNAPDAVRRPGLVDLAARSGTPLLIDPLTLLAQVEVDPEDPWVTNTTFGTPATMGEGDVTNPFILDRLVAATVEFQVENGATAVIPPYFYADRPDSPFFAASVMAIARTARRMRADGVALPILPILCAQLQGFAHRPGWQKAIDDYSAAAIEVGPQAIGLYLSPVGGGEESYSKLLDLLVAARHLRSAGAPVLGWRQGVYGPALVAAGLDGYECGMGIGEQSKARQLMQSHKPRSSSSRPFGAQGVYLAALGRSVPPKVARLLLDDRRLRGRLVCDSARCCPHGAASMQASRGRPHAVRARARDLAELDQMPSLDWRLHHIAKQAASAYVTATKANELLATTPLPNRIKTKGYEALEEVTDFLRSQGAQDRRDTGTSG